MEIGTYLRECRERRDITLHQIAASTKLSSTTLQLIERNAFDHLPGSIFTKGYLRAYAAEVGVDPEEVVNAVRRCPGRIKITGSNYQTFLAGSTPKAQRGMSASVG